MDVQGAIDDMYKILDSDMFDKYAVEDLEEILKEFEERLEKKQKKITDKEKAGEQPKEKDRQIVASLVDVVRDCKEHLSALGVEESSVSSTVTSDNNRQKVVENYEWTSAN